MAIQDTTTTAALLVSEAAAAQALGLGKTKTRELLVSGQLRSVRVGRRRLVPVAALEAFVAELIGDPS